METTQIEILRFNSALRERQEQQPKSLFPRFIIFGFKIVFACVFDARLIAILFAALTSVNLSAEQLIGSGNLQISTKQSGSSLIILVEAPKLPIGKTFGEPFTVENPDRLVIDIPAYDAKLNTKKSSTGSVFKQIRVGSQSDRTRIVFDLSSPLLQSMKSNRTGSSIEIVLQPPGVSRLDSANAADMKGVSSKGAAIEGAGIEKADTSEKNPARKTDVTEAKANGVKDSKTELTAEDKIAAPKGSSKSGGLSLESNPERGDLSKLDPVSEARGSKSTPDSIVTSSGNAVKASKNLSNASAKEVEAAKSEAQLARQNLEPTGDSGLRDRVLSKDEFSDSELKDTTHTSPPAVEPSIKNSNQSTPPTAETLPALKGKLSENSEKSALDNKVVDSIATEDAATDAAGSVINQPSKPSDASKRQAAANARTEIAKLQTHSTENSSQLGIPEDGVSNFPVISKLSYQVVKGTKEPAFVVDLSKQANFSFRKLDDDQFVLVIEHGKLAGKHLALEQFPPDSFNGFEVVVAKETAEGVEVSIYTEDGTKLNPYFSEGKLWVRATP